MSILVCTGKGLTPVLAIVRATLTVSPAEASAGLTSIAVICASGSVRSVITNLSVAPENPSAEACSAPTKPSPATAFASATMSNVAEAAPAGISTDFGNDMPSLWSDASDTVSGLSVTVLRPTVTAIVPPSVTTEAEADSERAGPSSS